MDWIKWEDMNLIFTGITHSMTHSDGSVVSVGMTIDFLTMGLRMLVYRM